MTIDRVTPSPARLKPSEEHQYAATPEDLETKTTSVDEWLADGILKHRRKRYQSLEFSVSGLATTSRHGNHAKPFRKNLFLDIFPVPKTPTPTKQRLTTSGAKMLHRRINPSTLCATTYDTSLFFPHLCSMTPTHGCEISLSYSILLSNYFVSRFSLPHYFPDKFTRPNIPSIPRPAPRTPFIGPEVPSCRPMIPIHLFTLSACLLSSRERVRFGSSPHHLQRPPPPAVPQATQDDSGAQSRSSGLSYNLFASTYLRGLQSVFFGGASTKKWGRCQTRSRRLSPWRRYSVFVNSLFNFPLMISSLLDLLFHLTLSLFIKQGTARLPHLCCAFPHPISAASPAWMIDKRHDFLVQPYYASELHAAALFLQITWIVYDSTNNTISTFLITFRCVRHVFNFWFPLATYM